MNYMTRRNFRDAAIRLKSYPLEERIIIAKFLIEFFSQDSWSFNKNTFLKWCGIGKTKQLIGEVYYDLQSSE